MANMDIRLAAKGAGVPFWMIANALSISEPTLTRRLRMELPPEQKTKIRSIIKELSSEFPSNGKNQSVEDGTMEEGSTA